MVGLMGLGAFGSVHLVEHRTTKVVSALKAVNLFHLNDKQKRLSEAQLANERLAFSRIGEHRFLLSCHQVFDEDNVTFLLLDACLGGDLSFMMSKGRHFTEKMAKFYGACLIIALSHLHSKRLVHCDVKPENILLDSKGYPKLCDYGNSKDISGGDAHTDLGTIEYCAPEIVERKPHGTAVDIWALGVFLCELATGVCPFAGQTRSITVHKIISETVDFSGCSPDFASLLRGMLDRDPATRADLGAIKAHRWFGGMDWDALAKQQLPAPIVPVITNNKDLSNFVVMDHTECSVCRGFGVLM
jgi:serine/threonine protein kinase